MDRPAFVAGWASPRYLHAGVETTVLAFADLGGDLADAVGANFVDLESVPELFQHPFQRV
ncbi:MAG: hypothetical protein H0W27_08315 [Actinobacteria bacterium]|nr:hypothetical protein [Actinomycetota bacterium]